MAAGRYRHAALALPDGRVIILGGGADNQTLSSVEIYDPQTGAFKQQGELVEARSDMTANLLADGRILVAGGVYADSNSNSLVARNSVEIYDPATGESAITAAMTDPRGFHSANPLPDGRILVAGGWDGKGSLRSADVLDPTTGKVSPTVPMSGARAGQAGVSLPDGRIVVIGGFLTDGTSLGTAEVYGPAAVAKPSP